MAHQAVYQKLIEVAQNEAVINYGAVAPIASIDVDNPHFAVAVGHLLDEINLAEHAEGRPLLSALVTGLDTNLPGPGFFKCARDLGVLGREDETVFWLTELKRVYDVWSLTRRSRSLGPT